MAPIYSVHYTFEGAAQTARFEVRPKAMRFAHGLEEIENLDRVHVTDEQQEGEDGYPKTIYDSEENDGTTP